MIRANVGQAVIMPPLALFGAARRREGLDPPVRELSAGGAADRFCAWAGRSGRRYVFSVFRLDPDAGRGPLALAPNPITSKTITPKTIALMVRRPGGGPRRVLWAELVETEGGVAAVMRAARQAGPEAGEIHLHVLSVEADARRAVFADLAFPRLGPAPPSPGFRLAG